ncbi:Fic family protein [Candidatus Dependentiae bacterium]|nr:Fic family protein [Candidatus Dependentiae bacterium]
MNEILERITRKKEQLDSFRPLPPALEKNLYTWARNELTYTSNAIEGNTLTSSQTAMVIEKGLTIGGKTFVEHCEAIGHAKAVDFIKVLASGTSHETLTLDHILAIHHLILDQIDAHHAGALRTVAVRISGSRVPRPNYIKLPELMQNFVITLNQSVEHPALLAAKAHLLFVFIHPFVDGNGRTARLLMNLLLLQGGYPLTVIGVDQRNEYIDNIENALLHEKPDGFYEFIFQAVEKSLDDYLDAVSNSARGHIS